MSDFAAHIDFKQGAVSNTTHNPIPEPFHFKEPVW